jgi:ketosteroid isomerase-like protein
MKKLTLIGFILLMYSFSVAASDQPGGSITTSPKDAADIQQVMDSFHHAVAAHDGKGVSALFLDHGSTWVTVLSDNAFATMRAKKPATQKVRVSSYQDFATFVSNTKSALSPRHENVQILSDGSVASVYFHFDFIIDGKVENRGDETWQLVKTADGWRIVALTFSSNPAAA